MALGRMSHGAPVRRNPGAGLRPSCDADPPCPRLPARSALSQRLTARVALSPTGRSWSEAPTGRVLRSRRPTPWPPSGHARSPLPWSENLEVEEPLGAGSRAVERDDRDPGAVPTALHRRGNVDERVALVDFPRAHPDLLRTGMIFVGMPAARHAVREGSRTFRYECTGPRRTDPGVRELASERRPSADEGATCLTDPHDARGISFAPGADRTRRPPPAARRHPSRRIRDSSNARLWRLRHRLPRARSFAAAPGRAQGVHAWRAGRAGPVRHRRAALGKLCRAIPARARFVFQRSAPAGPLQPSRAGARVSVLESERHRLHGDAVLPRSDPQGSAQGDARAARRGVVARLRRADPRRARDAAPRRRVPPRHLARQHPVAAQRPADPARLRLRPSRRRPGHEIAHRRAQAQLRADRTVRRGRHGARPLDRSLCARRDRSFHAHGRGPHARRASRRQGPAHPARGRGPGRVSGRGEEVPCRHRLGRGGRAERSAAKRRGTAPGPRRRSVAHAAVRCAARRAARGPGVGAGASGLRRVRRRRLDARLGDDVRCGRAAAQ